MATLSFKSTEDFKKNIELLAGRKGINISAYLKMLLAAAIQEELAEITPNGMTVAEEIRILEADLNGQSITAGKSISALKKALTA